MNRYATFLVVVTLATGFAALQTGTEPSAEPVSLLEALSNERKMQELLTQYRAFKGTFEATIESLRRGQLNLKEAHAIVREASDRYYPKYLKLLAISDKGASSDERLARNLVGHVRAIEAYRPTQSSAVASLNQELREFLAEIDP